MREKGWREGEGEGGREREGEREGGRERERERGRKGEQVIEGERLMYYFSQVLHLEQLLTTGGGWQDQCGGLYGGIKVSHSDKGLPVRIYTKQLDLSKEIFDRINQHIVLVYTGKTRLARNVLQVKSLGKEVS